MTRTVELVEVVWLVAAIPGLWMWLANRRSAARTLRAARTLPVDDGSGLWAKFSMLITNVFVFVESLFALIGVLAMATPPTSGATPAIRMVFSAGLIIASCAITYIGFRWRTVDERLLALAAAQTAALNTRTEGQDVREDQQDTRSAGLDTRQGRQDDRQGAQDTRQGEQDLRQDRQDTRDE